MGLYDDWEWIENIADTLRGAMAIYALKEAMTRAGWVVTQSGTGSYGIYDPTGDSISSAAVLQNGQAWICVEQPGGGRQWTFQCRGSAYPTSWRIKLSIQAGFVSGTPSATQTPAAADEQLLAGSGTDAAPGWSYVFPNADFYAQGGVQSASPHGWWLGGYTATGASGGSLGMLPVEAAAGDGDPYVYFVETSLSTTGPWSADRLSGDSYSPFGYLRLGQADQWWGRVPCMRYRQASYESVPLAGVANPHTGLDEALAILTARSSATGLPAGRKGYLQWLRWAAPTRSVGSTGSVVTDRDHIAMGHVWLPWGGAVAAGV